MPTKFHNGMTLEKFYLDWFGLQGGELGSNVPHPFGTNPRGHELSRRQFTQSPKQYLEFIEWCEKQNSACWITSQPMRAYNTPLGIEKIFFDFDYKGLKKNWNMTKIRRDRVKKQVLEFMDMLDVEPFVVATRKGYHVYVFLRRIFQFEPRNFAFAKDVFGVLGLSLLGMPKLYEQLEEEDRKKWKYVDFGPLGDICRMARVPLTIHEKTGLKCQILNRRLKPTKVRSVDLYRTYGLGEDDVVNAVKIVKSYYEKKIAREKRRLNSGTKDFENGNGRFEGQIRPCFKKRLEIGEMVHQQRLAFLMEAYHSGFKKKYQLMDLCRHFKDFNELISEKQIDWFLRHKTHFLPYRCKTIQAYGWCLKRECPMWKGKL